MREIQRIRKYINGFVNYHGKIKKYCMVFEWKMTLLGCDKNYFEVPDESSRKSSLTFHPQIPPCLQTLIS